MPRQVPANVACWWTNRLLDWSVSVRGSLLRSAVTSGIPAMGSSGYQDIWCPSRSWRLYATKDYLDTHPPIDSLEDLEGDQVTGYPDDPIADTPEVVAQRAQHPTTLTL